MHKLRTAIAALVTILILAQGVALAKGAKNYCISGFPNTKYIQVGQGFKIPAPGKCKAFNGFNAQNANLPTTGLGCTSSDGTNLSFTLTTGAQTGAPPFVEIDAISLSLTSQTGSVAGQEMFSNGVFSFTGSAIVGAACSTNTIPAVAEQGAASTQPPVEGGGAP